MKAIGKSILTVNGGSSSIKFALFETGDALRRILEGAIERIGLPDSSLRVKGVDQADNVSRPVTAPDHAASDPLYLEALAAPETINTVPEKTLLAFADHGKAKDVMRFDAGHAEALLAQFAREGVDIEALAAELQREGTAAFAKSWNALMVRIADKTEVLAKATQA